MNCKDRAYLFKVLGDETRLCIVNMLRYGTKCACTLLEEFDITQPTLSYHMKMLTDSKLVLCDKQGIWNYYSLNLPLIGSLSEIFSQVETVNNGCCKAK